MTDFKKMPNRQLAGELREQADIIRMTVLEQRTDDVVTFVPAFPWTVQLFLDEAAERLEDSTI